LLYRAGGLKNQRSSDQKLGANDVAVLNASVTQLNRPVGQSSQNSRRGKRRRSQIFSRSLVSVGIFPTVD
jgi:hypothetical protein